MLSLLDTSLEAFLRSVADLSKREIDVSFDAPDTDWGAGLTRPTVNLFLFDVRRNGRDREAGMELVETDAGPVRRPPLPRIDARYLVTAWTTDVRDEHALLGRVLSALFVHDEIDPEFLQGAYSSVRPVPKLRIAGENQDKSDFWSALGGQLKPGLELVVTATVDASRVAPSGPPVHVAETLVRDRNVAARVSHARFPRDSREEPKDSA